MIGTGGMARHHTRRILQQQDTTKMHVVCEPSGEAYETFCELFEEAGVEPPPNEPELAKLLDRYGDELDAAFIITPHVYHHDHAKACLEAGVDVLLEKPMVMNGAEAESLIETRDRT
ncbi:MAG: Gfo/Idh/MocA family oxidoreductase, partial [Caldilineaceae bacterium]|nr:Gfo/Idh/MocA family oxidoreductase [Caldilineaceae bacterium]